MSQPFNPRSPQNNPRNRDYRIGDAERQKAMDDLGKHFTAGRLDITEYDNRLTNVAEAIMWSDLIPIFSDLPAITDTNTSAATIILQDKLVAFTTMMTFLATFVLLYVMKLGPKSWHQPSPRALARQRRRQIAQAQAMQVQAMQLAHAQQMAERRLLWQQQQAEITNAALEVTNQYVQRLRNRNRYRR